MRWTILTIGVTLVMTALATGVAADDLVSVSGECYNDDYSEGGKAYIAVNEDVQLQEGGIITDDAGNINPAQSGGAVDALVHFGTRSAESSPGEACEGEDTMGNDDGRPERKDYLAVHVAGTIEVCYDGDTDVLKTNQDAWSCHTRPTGDPDA